MKERNSDTYKKGQKVNKKDTFCYNKVLDRAIEQKRAA